MGDLVALNPQQRQAVRHQGGPLLIMAGPGSGKTRCITQRIAWMVNEQGVQPAQILAITFTNKAANEMRSRLYRLIGREALEEMFVGTFHAWCYRLVVSHGDLLGYNGQTLTVVTEDSGRKQTLRRAIKTVGLDPKHVDFKDTLRRISRAQNTLSFSDEGIPDTSDEAVFLELYQAYREALLADNAIDFDELLSAAVRLLRDNPDVLECCQKRHRYLLVDEYQDVNQAQYALLRLLAQGHGNLCVVGDLVQGIYGWRGADIRFLVRFKQDYASAQEVLLEQSYRSTQKILQIANTVSSALPYGKRNLWTENPPGGPAIVHLADDDRSEARFVVRELQRLFKTGAIVDLSKCAVLYRTRAQARPLEAAFIEADVPYRLWGDRHRLMGRKEVADLLAYLEVVLNPSATHALARVINVPARGLAKTEKALDAGEAFHPEALGATKEGAAWLHLQADLRERAADPCFEVKAFIDHLLLATGYRAWLAKQEDAGERLANIEIVKSLAEGISDRSLAGFLGAIALLEDAGKDNVRYGVNLMTIHAAKGLEFPVVFITGLEDGMLPLHAGEDETASESLEEELRVFYVAITRAMERLYLCYARRRRLHGQSWTRPHSRFLKLLPTACLARG